MHLDGYPTLVAGRPWDIIFGMTDPTTNPIDYLVIGHVAKDLTPEGPVLGGTVAYAGRTAHALGLRVGIVTSAGTDIDLSPLDDLEVTCLPAEHTTTFENRNTPEGREQTLHARASNIGPEDIPPQWHTADIVHLGPIAAEVDPGLIDRFPDALVGITPQGWLRKWNQDGCISLRKWDQLIDFLPVADAVVLSVEDLGDDPQAAQEMAALCDILAVTISASGTHVFWNRQERHIPAPIVVEVDPTGSGDVFAAAFFVHLHQTKDPWEAAHFANHLAAVSVTRHGTAATPTIDEVRVAHYQVNP